MIELRFAAIYWFLMSLIPSELQAAPARGSLQQQRQGDGVQIMLRLQGDEHFQWLENADGYTVLRRDDGYYVYTSEVVDGKMRPSEFIVGQHDPAASGLQRGLYPIPEGHVKATSLNKKSGMQNQSQTATEAVSPNCSAIVYPQPVVDFANMVVLARFSDHASRTLPTREQMDLIFNQVGGDSVSAPSGSVKDYYSENSYGLCNPESTVSQRVELPQTEQFYSEGRYGRGPLNRLNEAIQKSLELLDPETDFSTQDKNGDGYVDCLTFVHSGYGSEVGGDDPAGSSPENRIWSRYALLDPPWVSEDGTKVCRVAVCPGLHGNEGADPVRIGVICHEIGHVLRLPDLYDGRVYGSDAPGNGIGCWGIMGYCWGFDSSQLHPPHFSAYSKIQLGWVTPVDLSTAGTFQVDAIEKQSKIYRLKLGFPEGEYLLIENRQPLGFDQLIPDATDGRGGLAIWHIDENQSDAMNRPGFPLTTHWPQRHYRVALLQADGDYHLEKGINRGDGADLYRGTLTGAIGPSTTPSTVAYQGGVLSVTPNSISMISASGGSMTFQIEIFPESPILLKSID